MAHGGIHLVSHRSGCRRSAGLCVSNQLFQAYSPDHGIIRRQGHFQVNESRAPVLVSANPFHVGLVLRAAHGEHL